MCTQLSPTPHLPRPQAEAARSLRRLTFGLNTLPIRNTAQSKIRMPTKTAENIANIIRGLYTFAEVTVPPRHNPANNLDTCKVSVVHRDLKAILILGNEVVVVRLTRWWTIEIRS